MSWIRQHVAWLLFGGLVILLLANAWLFLPRFVLDKQKLTATDLDAQMTALQQVANDGASLTNKIANQTAPQSAVSDLAALQQRSDDIVVVLQHSPYEVSLDDEVKADLELAQVVSFTLRDVGFSLDDGLKVSQTSQILAKAATSADSLKSQ